METSFGRANPLGGKSAVILRVGLLRTRASGTGEQATIMTISDTSSADRCPGVLVGLAAGDRILEGASLLVTVTSLYSLREWSAGLVEIVSTALRTHPSTNPMR